MTRSRGSGTALIAAEMTGRRAYADGDRPALLRPDPARYEEFTDGR